MSRYTRREILAAFGVGRTARLAAWQTGVYAISLHASFAAAVA